jgi:sensor c-di-GMP phosphodiesterase-like protein
MEIASPTREENGLKTGEFRVEYMPIVALRNGACVAAEALLRWNHNGAMVPPDEFIPFLEGGPLIGAVTYWLIHEIERELGAWLRSHSGMHISINVPPELFGRGGLHHAASQVKLDELYSQIVLEITERGTPDQIAVEGIRFARRLGVEIAIDDVETSDLSLLYLARTRLNYIKIDKSIVDKMETENQDSRVLEEIRQLIRLGEPKLVAEGLEREAQVNFLRKMGVQFGQGWFFGKSMEKRQFLAYVEENLRTQSGSGGP